ncbi:MAG: substrate-binding domain-containing protein [Anaerolineae bacterium]|nr:substrate-binding domain-containing protein [Anaerolineae bacterium]
MAARRCSNCDTPLSAQVRFCPECGISLLLPDKCRYCGTPLLPDERFCGECGREVRPVSTPEAVDTAEPGPPGPPPAEPEPQVVQEPPPVVIPPPISASIEPFPPPPVPRRKLPWMWISLAMIAIAVLIVLCSLLVVPKLIQPPTPTPSTLPSWVGTHTETPGPAAAGPTVTSTETKRTTASTVQNTATPLPTVTQVPPTFTSTPVDSSTPTPPFTVTPEAWPGKEYTIQPGDWLTTIAQREYDDPLAYWAIVYYTNLRCQTETRFTCIESPDEIDVGWLIYLPSAQEDQENEARQFAQMPPCNPASVTGDIEVIGSSTVYLLTDQMARLFKAAGFGGNVSVEETGTGGGFDLFCGQGQADIVNASRAIKDDELAQCRTAGREPLAFQVGTDALPIVVSQQNTFAQNLTLEQLKLLFTTATLWSDVDPAWPAEPIERLVPTQNHGTFDIFSDLVLDGDASTLLNADKLTMNDDMGFLVFSIQRSPYAVGFFGYAYYRDNSDVLRAISINGIEPRQETADSGTYPLLRPLFIYSTADIMQEKPQVDMFVNCYLRNVRQEILGVGYFLPDQERFITAIQTYLDAR